MCLLEVRWGDTTFCLRANLVTDFISKVPESRGLKAFKMFRHECVSLL